MTIVDVSREFLNTNGAAKHQNVHVEKATVWRPSGRADLSPRA